MNGAVMAWGQALLDADCERVGAVSALGLDETLYKREGRWRTRRWCTSIVDVSGGPVPRRCPWSRRHGPHRVAGGTTFGVARRHHLGHLGPLRRLPQRLHRGAAPRRPGRRPVPRDPPRQRRRRRDPPQSPERHARPPRPQRRPSLPDPAPAVGSPRTPRRPRRRQTPRPARTRRPPRRGPPGVARQGNYPKRLKASHSAFTLAKLCCAGTRARSWTCSLSRERISW